MDIFAFGVHFTDEQSCRLHFKEQRDQQGVVCHRYQGTDTIGLRTNGVINVSLARQEYPCAVVPLCRVPNYPL